MLRTATRRLPSEISTPGTSSTDPRRSTKTREKGFTIISPTSGSRIRCSMGRSKGKDHLEAHQTSPRATRSKHPTFGSR